MASVETEILSRTDLSFTAKGIYAYWCSLPEGALLTEDTLYSMPGPGAMSSTYAAAFQELVDTGLFIIEAENE